LQWRTKVKQTRLTLKVQFIIILITLITLIRIITIVTIIK